MGKFSKTYPAQAKFAQIGVWPAANLAPVILSC